MEDNFDLTEITKKTRKKVNSRQKGSSFERGISKLLNDTFNTDEFCRSPGSGAFATTHKLPEYLKIYGDLITPENFRFTIECKKGYNNINIYSLLDYSSKFWEFLAQSEKDSKSSKKESMVIFKQDRKPTLAIVKDSTRFSTCITHLTLTKDTKIYRIYKLEDILVEPIACWFTELA
jgi:hypothetical protein